MVNQRFDALAKPAGGLPMGEGAGSVVVEDAAGVSGYLGQYPGLADQVTAVAEAVRREFGREAALTLQPRQDASGDDRYLALILRLPAYGPDTFARIDAITDDHADAIQQAGGGLVLTTDYGQPR